MNFSYINPYNDVYPFSLERSVKKEDSGQKVKCRMALSKVDKLLERRMKNSFIKNVSIQIIITISIVQV